MNRRRLWSRKNIIDYKKLEVRRVRKPDEEIVSLLKETVLGSEGGMRYSMLNTEERIKSYGDGLTFMALYKKSSLKGVIGVCRRSTLNRGVRHSGLFLSALSCHSERLSDREDSGQQERETLTGRRQL
ncbi:MAG: hypothetical protein U5L72_17440 [Bacteroidales bacterium]|nr:hypothetical protein [Bacteroidales bacterium]